MNESSDTVEKEAYQVRYRSVDGETIEHAEVLVDTILIESGVIRFCADGVDRWGITTDRLIDYVESHDRMEDENTSVFWPVSAMEVDDDRNVDTRSDQNER